MIIPERVRLLWNGAWEGLSWCDVWTGEKKRKRKRRTSLHPAFNEPSWELEWQAHINSPVIHSLLIFFAGKELNHCHAKKPEEHTNLKCRPANIDTSKNSLQLWHSDLTKKNKKNKKTKKQTKMGFFLTHPLRCRRWKVCWFVVVNPVLVLFRGQYSEVSDPAQFSLFLFFLKCSC